MCSQSTDLPLTQDPCPRRVYSRFYDASNPVLSRPRVSGVAPVAVSCTVQGETAGTVPRYCRLFSRCCCRYCGPHHRLHYDSRYLRACSAFLGLVASLLERQIRLVWPRSEPCFPYVFAFVLTALISVGRLTSQTATITQRLACVLRTG